MVQRLAELRAQASLDGSHYVEEADRIADATDRMGAAQDRYRQSTTQTERRVEAGSAALNRLRRQIDPTFRDQERLTKGQDLLTREYERGRIKIDQYNKLMRQLNERYAQTSAATRSTAGEVGRSTGAYDRLRGSLLSVQTAAAGLGLVFGARETLRIFADYEQGLIGVGKTADLSGDELDALGLRIQGVAREVPVATTELLAIAQAAGQLGVQGVDDIVRFTDTVGKLGLASDLAGEDAASTLARILTVTGTQVSEVDRLGSTIVALGNNFAATESEIASVATRTAQATAQFDVTAAEVVGISTAMRAVGVEAEAGGTQVGLAFQAINDAIRGGGDEMKVLQEITGETREALAAAFFGGRSTQVFQSFVEGLAEVRAGGGDVAASLESMGLEGVRAVQVLGTLATRSEILGETLSMANAEWQSNTALTKEALTAATSFSSQMQLVANAIDEAAVELGRALAPALVDSAQAFAEWIREAKDSGDLARVFADVGDALEWLAQNLELVIGGAAALKLAQFGFAIGSAFGPIGALVGGAAGALVGFGATMLAVADDGEVATKAIQEYTDAHYRSIAAQEQAIGMVVKSSQDASEQSAEEIRTRLRAAEVTKVQTDALIAQLQVRRDLAAFGQMFSDGAEAIEYSEKLALIGDALESAKWDSEDVTASIARLQNALDGVLERGNQLNGGDGGGEIIPPAMNDNVIEATDNLKVLQQTVADLREGLTVLGGAGEDALVALTAQQGLLAEATQLAEQYNGANKKRIENGQSEARSAQDYLPLLRERLKLEQDRNAALQVSDLTRRIADEQKLQVAVTQGAVAQAAVNDNLAAYNAVTALKIERDSEAARTVGDLVKQLAEQQRVTAAMLAIQDLDTAIAKERDLAAAEMKGAAAIAEVNAEYEIRARLAALNIDAESELGKKIAERIRVLSQEKEATRRSEEAAELYRETWLNALEDVQETLTDGIERALSGELTSLRDWADEFMAIIRRLAANLISQQIVVPITTSVAGSLGLPVPTSFTAANQNGGVAGSIFSNPLSTIQNIISGPGNIARSFVTGSIGQSLGLSTPIIPTGPTMIAPGIGAGATALTAGQEAAAIAGGWSGLGPTAAGQGLISAAGPVAIAAMAAMMAYQFGLIGPGPTSGPVGIADFSPGLGRDLQFGPNAVNPLEFLTADNGGNAEGMRPIAEAIADLIADNAERFSATIDSTLRFRVANYANPEDGNSGDRVQGFEVNAFIRGEAERRIAEGLDQTQAIFEAFNYAVKEAFTFESDTLQEIARNTSATTTEDLLSDLAFGKYFDDLRSAITGLGGEVNQNTLAQAQNTLAIQEQAEKAAEAAIEPILSGLQKAIELFPARTGAVQSSADTSAFLVNEIIGKDEGSPVVTGYDVVDAASGDLLATYERQADAIAEVNRLAAERAAALNSESGAVARTAEELARYQQNLERVDFAIGVTRVEVDNLVDTISGAFEPDTMGPFATALATGRAELEALRQHLNAVNEEIKAANTAFPELQASLIDVATTIDQATATLLATLQEDFVQSVQAQINTAQGNDFLNTVQQILDTRDAVGAEATALGLNVNDTAGALFSAQISNLIQDLTAEQLSLILQNFDDEALTGAVNDVIASLGGLSDATLLSTADLAAGVEAFTSTLEGELSTLERATSDVSNSIRRFYRAIDSNLVDRTLSPLSPLERLAESERQLMEAFEAANDNTPDDVESREARERLADLVETDNRLAKDYYASSENYSERFYRNQELLRQTAKSQESIEQTMLSRLTEIRDLLAVNDNGPQFGTSYTRTADGQYVSDTGFDLGANPEVNLSILNALRAANLPTPTGFGEGQLNALRASNPQVNALLTALQFANGAAFINGLPISYYANGTVLDTPTLFGMPGGLGMMAEAGPEAIMPLERINGALGIRAIIPANDGIGRSDLMALIELLRADNAALRKEVELLREVVAEGAYQNVDATWAVSRTIGRSQRDARLRPRNGAAAA